MINNQYDKGFWLAYNRHISNDFTQKTQDIVKCAKGYSSEYLKLFKRTYDDTISQIIASLLSTLVYKAKKEPYDYIKNRKIYLKEIADVIITQNGFHHLFEFIKDRHKEAICAVETEMQIVFEIEEIIDLCIPFNKIITGINNDKPILVPSPFPFTKRYIGKINQLVERNKKETQEIMNQNFARAQYKAQILQTFGFYNYDNLDLAPTNVPNLNHFEKDLSLPRKAAETDLLLDMIRKKRRYLLNVNGIVIDCYNAGDIESIIIQELQGFLVFKINLKKQGWIINNKGYLVDDINGGQICGFIDLRTFDDRSDEYWYNFSIYALLSEFQDIYWGIENFLIECCADLYCGSNYLNRDKLDTESSILASTTISDEEIEKNCKSRNVVGLRYTPFNLYRNGKRTTSRTSLTTREKYFVTGHIRKLFDGAIASPEAKRNAEEYGIQLPQGYTFVLPHYSGLEKIRTYYKKIV